MIVAFRVDASLEIGTGHVMRCLTLARALTDSGAICRFLCRTHIGNLIARIQEAGFAVTPFASDQESANPKPMAADPDAPPHSSWLGADWRTDAEQTIAALENERADWLIVDHYALDARWERQLRNNCRRLMVIDDLADRRHDCDLLLDQNIGRQADDYRTLTPSLCRTLIGPQYALLRPEFAKLREFSLRRRVAAEVKTILITMGGVDRDNATGQVLQALMECGLPNDVTVNVVMGSTAPWIEEVHALAARTPWPTNVLTDVHNMAQLMAESDLAIGAAGSTSWERCCLGVPTILLSLADNQRHVAKGLERIGAAIYARSVGSGSGSAAKTAKSLFKTKETLRTLSKQCANICDGKGTDRIVATVSTASNEVKAVGP
jgi:UDP-2,4-diacetamido-2,4,6-trideoxy-beta-L-altropyranose hydrolase